MLDVAATKEAFEAWVRSPEFDRHFRAAVGAPPTWSLVVGGVASASIIGLPLGIPLLIYGLGRRRGWRAARKDAHRLFSDHQPLLCAIIIANSEALRTPGGVTPALLVGRLGPQDEASLAAVGHAARVLAELYGADPADVPEELHEACHLVNDDEYQQNRRRAVPDAVCSSHRLTLFDSVLSNEMFDSGTVDFPFVPCLAAPDPPGAIRQIPFEVAVFHERTDQGQVILNHEPPSQPPPLVAPVSENLEAIERHIAGHLGEPTHVFHEAVSTTVHIDVHIVPSPRSDEATCLITSGMSDIPMTTPEDAGEWRFAELMMRLPADWPLSQQAFTDERHYWPIRCLKMMARFPHELSTWIGSGHSIGVVEPPNQLAPGVAFSALLVTPPWIGGESFATLRLADDTPVHFWTLIPIHQSELDFKLQHGVDALLDRLVTAGYDDVIDPSRPPVA